MLAATPKEVVPAAVHHQVAKLHEAIVGHLRSVKFEWVWDSRRVWLVQLHHRRKGVSEDVIYPGETAEQVVFDPGLYDREDVLEKLRDLVSEIRGKNIGVIVTGDVHSRSKKLWISGLKTAEQLAESN